MDIYVLYGHDDDTVCVQKNNTNAFIDQAVAALSGSYRVDLLDGVTPEANWQVDINKTKGWWELSSSFTSNANVKEIHKLNQKTVGANRSDDTVKWEVSNGRTLEFTKL